MNYRHAYHAGNFADCMKHALLVWLVGAMARKPAPFTVLDTHAGAGRYDLQADAAERTGEWRAGIDRLRRDPPPLLSHYMQLVERLDLYPGSPVLLRAMLRPDDRLICTELHPEDSATLRRHFARDRQVAVHERDGYAALRALLPPAHARGLVLIDPPFEQPGEYDRLADGLALARKRFAAGVLVAWYPIKGRAPVRQFHATLQARGLRDVIAAELWIREPTDAARLNGCGLVVCNPPYPFELIAPPMLAALQTRLGETGRGAGYAVTRLVDE